MLSFVRIDARTARNACRLPTAGAQEPGGITSALWGQAKIGCAPIIYARMSEPEDMLRYPVHHDRGVSRPTP